MRKFDPWPVFFKREWNRNWPFLVGFAVTGLIVTKVSLGLTEEEAKNSPFVQRHNRNDGGALIMLDTNHTMCVAIDDLYEVLQLPVENMELYASDENIYTFFPGEWSPSMRREIPFLFSAFFPFIIVIQLTL